MESQVNTGSDSVNKVTIHSELYPSEIMKMLSDSTISHFNLIADGRLCIRFGMVSLESDVEELLALVVKTGSQLDEQVFLSIYSVDIYKHCTLKFACM